MNPKNKEGIPISGGQRFRLSINGREGDLKGRPTFGRFNGSFFPSRIRNLTFAADVLELMDGLEASFDNEGL